MRARRPKDRGRCDKRQATRCLRQGDWLRWATAWNGARPEAGRLLAIFLCAVAGAACAFALLPGAARASKSQWSVFEDHPWIVQTDAATRDRTLNEIVELGADTVRVEVKWNEVAPSSSSKTRPPFDATNPSAYPGFAPYDDAVRAITARGLRVLLTITGDAPRWATSGGRGGNYKPNAASYAQFATAVGKRYSGTFSGVPKVGYFTIWNEPNHIQFIKPTSQAPRRLPQAGRRRAAGAEAGRRPRQQDLRRRAEADAAQGPGPDQVPAGLALPRQELQAPAGQGRAQEGLHQVQEDRRERLRAPSLRPGRPGLRAHGHRQPARDQAARQGARPGREGRQAAARARHLQHRVRHPDQPAGHLRLDVTRAPGRASSTRRKSSPTATRASRATRSTSSTTTPVARGRRPSGGRASRPACASRTAPRSRPGMPTGSRSWSTRRAARWRSGAACDRARAAARCSCNASPAAAT